MTCRDSESLILAERDGVLTQEQRAVLSDHVAACPSCQRLRADLATALAAFKTASANVRVPDTGEAWRDLQSRLHESAKPAKKRPLAPVIWFAAPLAAAAALAFAFLTTRPVPAPPSRPAVAAIAPPPLHDPSVIAGADFVEAGDPNASTMVYVDKDSGWLVVWATDDDTDTPTSG